MPPDIQFMLGQMNAKLDTLIARAEEDRVHVAQLETRISELEALKWKFLGAAGALGAVCGGAAEALFKVVSHG